MMERGAAKVVECAWSRIVCKHPGMSAEDLAASVRDVCRAPLTRARPRLDAVCRVAVSNMVQACQERVDGQLVFVQ